MLLGPAWHQLEPRVALSIHIGQAFWALTACMLSIKTAWTEQIFAVTLQTGREFLDTSNELPACQRGVGR